MYIARARQKNLKTSVFFNLTVYLYKTHIFLSQEGWEEADKGEGSGEGGDSINIYEIFCIAH